MSNFPEATFIQGEISIPTMFRKKPTEKITGPGNFILNIQLLILLASTAKNFISHILRLILFFRIVPYCAGKSTKGLLNKLGG